MANRKVYIHTNSKQLLGALVARHTLKRNSREPDRFDVEVITAESFAFLARFEGRSYLRENKAVEWCNDDLQSFTPLRFCVPELMSYRGRAVVIDPDVFAVGDINDLLDAEMNGAAILARRMAADGRRPLHFASSVMLLDCERLEHWKVEEDFEKLFHREVDYRDWMWLLREPPNSVGPLDPAWNDFDQLTAATRLLHNTHRRTQPWKTGLPADFTTRGTTFWKRAGSAWRSAVSRVTGRQRNGFYRAHPDPAQEHFFFRMLGECLELGSVTTELLGEEIRRQHVRADAADRVLAVKASISVPVSG